MVASLADGVDYIDDVEELETPQYRAGGAANWAIQSDEVCEEYGVIDPDIEDCAILASQWAASAVRTRKKETAMHCSLLRDIFGNPFRPVAFDPAWRTATAVGIAAKMYDSRDFAAMPILADALQDAGCENDAILRHCREEATHVRGCWVVDLVLGKQ
jgi:hypothetical protein